MDNFNNDNNDNNNVSNDNNETYQETRSEESQSMRGHDDFVEKSCKKEKHRRQSGMAYLATGLIGALIGGMMMAYIAPTYLYGKIIPFPQGSNTNTAQLGQQVVIKPTDSMTVATAVTQKVKPAVVGISTVEVQTDIFGYSRSAEGVGSGFVVNPNGYILTNAHVVGTNPKELKVYFMDGKELDGTVLWKDTSLDLAVVKVNATNLPTVELADSDKIEVGELAIAIGNPLGLRFERTVTQGIISGLNRSLLIPGDNSVMEDLIQTDAAINPGNSGGPLINNQGQIVGINTAKAEAENLGFAIPINIAKPILNQIINTGKFQATYLGIGLLDREIAGYLDTNIEIKNGIYITSVQQGNPADKAGLKAEDIITHVDGVEVNTMVEFKSLLYNKMPGDKVKITYQRNNKVYNTEATLIAKPGE